MLKRIVALGVIVVALSLGSLEVPAAPVPPVVTGTVTINGHVSQMVSLSFWDSAVIGAGVSQTTVPAQDAALIYAVDLGDVGPLRADPWVGFVVRVGVRSNAPRTQLTLQRTAQSFPAGGPTTADIGIGVFDGTGIVCADPSGAQCNAAGAAPVGTWGTDPQAGTVNGDGSVTYANDLSDLNAQTQVMATPNKISTGGSLQSVNNVLLVPTKYVIKPNAWSAVTFSAEITYTLTNV